MKIKHFLLGATMALTVGAAAVGVSSIAMQKEAEVVEAAGTNTTVYYAVSSSVVGSYTVKLNVNYKGDGDDWHQFTMTKTSNTYNGLLVYSCSYTDAYNGVGVMQFQLYNGNTHVSQQQPISSWTGVSTYNGKMYVHGKDWYSYKTDSTYTIYLDPFDWANLYIHVWNDYDLDTWPGTKITINDTNLQFNGGQLQAYTMTVPSGTKFIYNIGSSSNQSDTFTVTNNAYYWHNGSAWTQETGNLASAAKFVYEFNTARLAVAGSGNVKAFSICGLDYSTWYTRYNNLGGAKTNVDSASIYTYKDKSSSGADTRVTFAEIMEYMRGEIGAGARFLPFNLADNNGGLPVVIVIASILVVGAASAAYFTIRRRKEN